MKYVSSLSLLLALSSTAYGQLKRDPKLSEIKFLQPPISGFVKSSSESVVAPVVQGIPEELQLSVDPIELELVIDQFLTRAAEDLELNGNLGGPLSGGIRDIIVPSDAATAEILDAEIFDTTPLNQPHACPNQIGAAAYKLRTYARGESANYSYPNSGSGCVIQPDGDPANQTCALPSSLIPDIEYQVCDYQESVTEHECNLLNVAAGYGYSTSHPLRYRVIGSPAKYCQKFTNGSFKVLLSIPIKATNPIDNLVDIQSGEQFSCALRKTSSSSDLYCWGLNDKGQLGIDTVGLLSTHAIKAHLPGDVEAFSVTHANVCAVLKPQAGFRAGRLFCWGDNSNNQLGFASTSAIPAASGKPKEIPLIVYSSNNFGTSAIAITARSPVPVYGHQVKYSNYNNVSAGGRNLDPASSSSTPEIVKKISIGFELDRDALPTKFTGCFVTNSNNVYCWGANTYGQAGTGIIHSGTPVDRVILRQAFANSGGFSYSLPSGVSYAGLPSGSVWSAEDVKVMGNVICIVGKNATSIAGKVLCAGVTHLVQVIASTVTYQNVASGLMGSRFLENNSYRYSPSSGGALETLKGSVFPMFVDVLTGSSYSNLSNVINLAANDRLACARHLKTSAATTLGDVRGSCWGRVPGLIPVVTTDSFGRTVTTLIPSLIFEKTAKILTFGPSSSASGSEVSSLKSLSVGDGVIAFPRDHISLGSELFFLGQNRNEMLGICTNFTSSSWSGSCPTAGTSSTQLIGEPTLAHPTSAGGLQDAKSQDVVMSANGGSRTGHHCHIKNVSSTANNAYCSGFNSLGQLGNGELDALSHPNPDVEVQF
jgi:hypothetical protein